MGEPGDGAGLALEALAQQRVAGVPRAHDFEGDGAVQAGVERAVHLAHPANARRRDDLVVAQPSARCDRHRARL